VVSEEAKQRMRAAAAKYPTLRSAVLPALHIAQEEEGYITQDALDAVAEVLKLTPDEVKTVATFYTMYFKERPGKRVIHVCTSISCYLRGCDHLVEHLEKRLGIKRGETTPDGRFTLLTAECLASCGSAPVLQVNNEFVEHVTLESADALIDQLNHELDAADGSPASKSQQTPVTPGKQEQPKTEAAGPKRR